MPSRLRPDRVTLPYELDARDVPVKPEPWAGGTGRSKTLTERIAHMHQRAKWFEYQWHVCRSDLSATDAELERWRTRCNSARRDRDHLMFEQLFRSKQQ